MARQGTVPVAPVSDPRSARGPRRADGCRLRIPALLASLLLLALSWLLPVGAVGEEASIGMKLTSSAFEAGASIPTKYTGEGQDVSPPLSWTEPPQGTRQFALICDDPDAPMPKPFVHWVAYRIPADTRALPEATRSGFVSGRNDFGGSGYRGPMPPRGHGIHHYHFVLFALDATIDSPTGLTKDELLERIRDHELARAELIGTYERP